MIPVRTLTQSKPSYIREILSVVASGDIISLAGGLPCPDTFPMQMIEDTLPSLGQQRSLFQYAETAGYAPLIHSIRQRYDIAETHELLMTNGSQQGIDLCARVFINKGDSIVVENPSYLGALQIFALAEANVLSVPQEHDGPNLTALEALFAQGSIRFFYGIPDFHNPTGCCWSLAKRQGVASLCQQYDVLFIEDAPYREIRFSRTDLPTLLSLCPDHTIMLRSFSKMISPALRIAALITPKRWYSYFCKLKQSTDLHTSVPTQHLTHAILDHPDFDAHLANTNHTYGKRYQALANELSQLCDMLGNEDYCFTPVEGGMFVWLQIPKCDTLALANNALSKGVAVVPGSEFAPEQHSVNTSVNTSKKTSAVTSALRLNFSYNNPERIKEGLNRLAPLLKDCR